MIKKDCGNTNTLDKTVAVSTHLSPVEALLELISQLRRIHGAFSIFSSFSSSSTSSDTSTATSLPLLLFPFLRFAVVEVFQQPAIVVGSRSAAKIRPQTARQTQRTLSSLTLLKLLLLLELLLLLLLIRGGGR